MGGIHLIIRKISLSGGTRRLNLDRSTATRSGPFRSNPRAQGARGFGDHKVEGQWRDGGRRLTGSSPEFGRRRGLARRRLLRAWRGDADTDSVSSFTVVARIDDTVFPNSDSVPAITGLSLRSTWETEDRVVRTRRLQRTRVDGRVGQKLAVKLQIPARAADRKSTRLNSSHSGESRMPSSA